MKPATGIGAEAQADPAAAPGAGRRVLIVDDNVDAADSLAMILAMGGHETLCVYGPEAALDGVGAFRPEVVLLDIGLPRMDGYEVARRIRAGAARLRLVALSGYGSAQDTQRALSCGFDAYLVKPVDFAELERVLCETR